VKTLSDDHLGDVNFKDTVSSTVAEQIQLQQPKQLSSMGDMSTSRFSSEHTLYRLRVQLVGYKEEFSGGKGDHDFHMIIRDPNATGTMLIEVLSTADCDAEREFESLIRAYPSFSNMLTTKLNWRP
jgi:hypothetical protein